MTASTSARAPAHERARSCRVHRYPLGRHRAQLGEPATAQAANVPHSRRHLTTKPTKPTQSASSTSLDLNLDLPTFNMVPQPVWLDRPVVELCDPSVTLDGPKPEPLPFLRNTSGEHLFVTRSVQQINSMGLQAVARSCPSWLLATPVSAADKPVLSVSQAVTGSNPTRPQSGLRPATRTAKAVQPGTSVRTRARRMRQSRSSRGASPAPDSSPPLAPNIAGTSGGCPIWLTRC